MSAISMVVYAGRTCAYCGAQDRPADLVRKYDARNYPACEQCKMHAGPLRPLSPKPRVARPVCRPAACWGCGKTRRSDEGFVRIDAKLRPACGRCASVAKNSPDQGHGKATKAPGILCRGTPKPVYVRHHYLRRIVVDQQIQHYHRTQHAFEACVGVLVDRMTQRDLPWATRSPVGKDKRSRFVAYVQKNPGTSVRDLVEAVGISHSYVEKLRPELSHVVEEDRAGRRVTLYPRKVKA